MESSIAQALKLKYHPVAVIWTDDRPEKAMGFKQGKWGCVMWMLAAAAKGKATAFDKSTYGCWGGGVDAIACQFQAGEPLVWTVRRRVSYAWYISTACHA